MEMLFSRLGIGRLEGEMQFLFGQNLRALGGDGTLDLTRYLSSWTARCGRRALVIT
jgi:hypothetical protein